MVGDRRELAAFERLRGPGEGRAPGFGRSRDLPSRLSNPGAHRDHSSNDGRSGCRIRRMIFRASGRLRPGRAGRGERRQRSGRVPPRAVTRVGIAGPEPISPVHTWRSSHDPYVTGMTQGRGIADFLRFSGRGHSPAIATGRSGERDRPAVGFLVGAQPLGADGLEVGPLALVGLGEGEDLRVGLDPPGPAGLEVDRRPPVLVARSGPGRGPRPSCSGSSTSTGRRRRGLPSSCRPGGCTTRGRSRRAGPRRPSRNPGSSPSGGRPTRTPTSHSYRLPVLGIRPCSMK